MVDTNPDRRQTLIPALALGLTTSAFIITKTGRGEITATPAPEIECERFPDQCPCTTELGKGIA